MRHLIAIAVLPGAAVGRAGATLVDLSISTSYADHHHT
jgi:hypothetical protein